MKGDVVVGAGMGGLAAAIHLARSGRHVTLLEARDGVGGLASGFHLGGRRYDGGPYILLDRPGLTWAFRQLGADLDSLVSWIELDEVYRVSRANGPTVSVWRGLERTAQGIEALQPGGGDRYRRYIERMTAFYGRLQPLQRGGRPNALSVLRRGLFREIPFLLRPLGHHLAATGLPQAVQDALAIWTHIAAQPLDKAPAPLAFVPAIIHTHGAYTLQGGIGRISEVLLDLARAVGVTVHLGTRVSRIVRDGRRVLGVEADGERIDADRVFSNAPGIGTYVNLLDPPDPELSARLQRLPLQSPGVAAYLEVEHEESPPFLQFQLVGSEPCRGLLLPGGVDPSRGGNARLLSPMSHDQAERLGREGQAEHLERLLEESWWKAGIRSHEVLARRTPVDWGQRYHLYRDSMNPVMTAAFMRKGRLPHQSPVAHNLYLVGSATHPGQWVSFCLISGILAAQGAA
jgi:phytoene dehydrogenase-like protein